MIYTLNKKDFPRMLSEIDSKPNKLYIRGTLPNENTKILCIVGARHHSAYGEKVCKELIQGLKGYDICIVSGLAIGIDSIAHKAALDNGLKTIAFPGSGLDTSVMYPLRHRDLAQEIVDKGGALISEFSPLQKAMKWTFPQRNRLMAGISQAVLIIEAERKSGTLITSKYATEYNRDVGAVPGDIYSPLSEGPHMLIRLGATPITSSQDILELLGCI